MTHQEIEDLSNCDKINLCILLHELRKLYREYDIITDRFLFHMNTYSNMYGYALYCEIPYNINIHNDLISMLNMDMSMILL